MIIIAYPKILQRYILKLFFQARACFRRRICGGKYLFIGYPVDFITWYLLLVFDVHSATIYYRKRCWLRKGKIWTCSILCSSQMFSFNNKTLKTSKTKITFIIQMQTVDLYGLKTSKRLLYFHSIVYLFIFIAILFGLRIWAGS